MLNRAANYTVLYEPQSKLYHSPRLDEGGAGSTAAGGSYAIGGYGRGVDGKVLVRLQIEQRQAWCANGTVRRLIRASERPLQQQQ